jgi:protein-S-isoprenylcysteine O-methyltransferase Ste14
MAQEAQATQSKRQIARAVVGFILYLFLTPALMFVAAGTWDWPAGWAYFALALVAIIGSRAIVARRTPALLRERARFTEAEGAAGWDRILSPLVGIVAPLLIGVVAGIDHRLAWGPVVSLPIRVIAGVVIAAGFAFSSWAMISNRFFSAVVRIQEERGHEVVTSGPYRFVRHPSYAGGALSYLALPLMLDALWAMVPALLVVVALAVRTALEDRTLLEGLPGYRDYAARTRSRLIPGIW